VNPAVAELQGLYGPFAFPELLLQKLWWRREFASESARTMDGRTLVVHSPGRWNRLGGPDFRDAGLELEGVRTRGDVEVHLRASDWNAHGHGADRAYDGVILHVVLFPPAEPITAGARGPIPVLALLPLLWHDLEEYATDEAIATLLNRPEHRIAAELTPLPAPQLLRLLREHGAQRWAEKQRFARRRVDRLGWEEACHQTALEILGYRVNRAGMLRVAGQWPWREWATGRVEPEEVFNALRVQWVLQGVRPANHPRRRLRQYADWVRQRPDWPEALRRWSATVLPIPDLPSLMAPARRALGFPHDWEQLRSSVSGSAVPSPRGDNVLSDGLLPLAAAAGGLSEATGFQWWWHGYPGTLPDPWLRALRELGWAGSASSPAATGPAQGLLGWLLAREAQALGGQPNPDRQGA
jgi:hypothetical protein